MSKRIDNRIVSSIESFMTNRSTISHINKYITGKINICTDIS